VRETNLGNLGTGTSCTGVPVMSVKKGRAVLFAGFADFLAVGAAVNTRPTDQFVLPQAAVEDIISFTAIESVISPKAAEDVIPAGGLLLWSEIFRTLATKCP
jgi:hypothetical protein